MNTVMTASEHLQGDEVTECPECHYPTEYNDWKYKNFICKTVAICPQCSEEIHLGY